MPLPIVALPCGSRSTSNTRCRVAARLAARLTLVVVLPTPPFWLVIARIFAIASSLRAEQHQMSLGVHAGHLQGGNATQFELRGHIRNFLIRIYTFHRSHRPIPGA